MLREEYLRGTESFAGLFVGLIALLAIVPFAQRQPEINDVDRTPNADHAQ